MTNVLKILHMVGTSHVADIPPTLRYCGGCEHCACTERGTGVIYTCQKTGRKMKRGDKCKEFKRIVSTWDPTKVESTPRPWV